ncbi:MAG: DUF1622 domain-containing protein [Ruminococcaceae bacterium]|nr:DUF1622 domain-containing protein [Oscillospiraceae bacterium]
MTATYQWIENIFLQIIQYAALVIELIGVAVLIWAVIRALIVLIRRGDHMRLLLAEGIALALEFKMGGELLRTVIIRDWHELLVLGAVILLRAAMTFLIQWEIRVERRLEKEKNNAESKEKT